MMRPLYTIPFNPYFVRYLCGEIRAGHGERGTVLETLTTYLIRTVEGLVVKNRQMGMGGEIDILVGNFASPGEPLRWFGDYFLIECKDTNDVVRERDLGRFLTKLNLTKTKQGAIVSKEGLSGSSGFGYATRDRKIAYSEMTVAILDIQLGEIEQLNSTEEFLLLLQQKYEDLRFY
jgi:hypothetical protein